MYQPPLVLVKRGGGGAGINFVSMQCIYKALTVVTAAGFIDLEIEDVCKTK